MTVRAVFFDVGETLVDEEHYWRVVAEAAGIGPHVVWAALGVTIARNEEHWELWRHLDLARPAGAWESVVYSIDDLYPDAIDCLERLRADALFVGVAGNQTAALEEWARSSELPVDVVTGSSRLPAHPQPRSRTSATGPTTMPGRRWPRGWSPSTSVAARGGGSSPPRRVRSRSSRSRSSRAR